MLRKSGNIITDSNHIVKTKKNWENMKNGNEIYDQTLKFIPLSKIRNVTFSCSLGWS